LKIWQDKNSDGKLDEGELLSLAPAGVKSLNTNYNNSNEVDANNNATALWRPSWWESVTAGHNFGRGPSNDYSIKVWLGASCFKFEHILFTTIYEWD
jgi:hypothetical protein